MTLGFNLQEAQIMMALDHHCVVQFIGECHKIILTWNRVGRIFQLFIYVLWDQSLGHFVFGSPLGGSWGGSKQVGESPEAVILQVLLPIIKIPIFF